jgi:hypothetical protein
MTLQSLKSEFRLMSSGDEWGDVMQWWFTIADEIYFNRDHLSVPREWQFKPSPLGPCNDPDDYATHVVQEADDESLAAFGALMNRYARLLRHCGKDY